MGMRLISCFVLLTQHSSFSQRVGCGSRWTYGVIGVCFKVVTNCKSADEVSARIEQFLTDFRATLVDMSNETFFEHVVGLAKDKLQSFNSLEEESGSLWSEIIENRYDFEVHRNEAEELKKVTKEDILKAFDKWLSPESKNRRKLDVHAIGSAEGIASDGRPTVETSEDIGETIDVKVGAFHKVAAGKTWGSIY